MTQQSKEAVVGELYGSFKSYSAKPPIKEEVRSFRVKLSLWFLEMALGLAISHLIFIGF